MPCSPSLFFFFTVPLPPTSPLFPYTTLFRSQLHSGPRWDALRESGATVQRCLWASTSTKNPSYRDVMYVEELIGPARSEEHTSELQSPYDLVCRLLLEKKNQT